MILLKVRHGSVHIPPLRRGITHWRGKCWRSRHFYIWTTRRLTHGRELFSGRPVWNGWRRGLEVCVSWRVRDCGIHPDPDGPTRPRPPALPSQERKRRRGPHPVDLLGARHDDPDREASA